MDAGYPQFAERLFDWCQIHQDPAGLWHQRYFLNGALAPNWCLPPDTLQIDQVGAVLWAYGKMRLADSSRPADAGHLDMVRRAADYLVSRLTDQGVHANAFDTWESFVGSFTYSNSSIYAGLRAAALVLNEPAYDAAADRIKAGVRAHFMKDDYLIRGFNAGGGRDEVVDSSSIGAIEPFGLLDLKDPQDLEIAEATLRVTRERLEQDWEGGKAIRRFEWDAYVGGVPACVNTLWMARCCLKLAHRLQDLDRAADAAALTEQAQVYLTTVLRRTTPTGLLPELMQGPTGQPFWAAPHGWAMASFVSGVLMLASRWKR
jgi:GH15 family glucan-1,4-alpha-glucosidase